MGSEVILPKKVHAVYGGQYLKWDALEAIAEMLIQPKGISLLKTTAAGHQAAIGIRNISCVMSEDECSAVQMEWLVSSVRMIAVLGVFCIHGQDIPCERGNTVMV